MENYKIYIHRVLKQVHPDLHISKDSLELINLLINNYAIHLIKSSNEIIHPINYKTKKIKNLGKKTIDSRDIESAVRLIIPGQVANHAVSEGNKALDKFADSTNGYPSKRAGLQFSIARTDNLIRKYIENKTRVSQKAAVYLAAVLEYLTAEIVELAGNAAMDNKKKTISTIFIKLAINNDEELNEFNKIVKIYIPGFKNATGGKDNFMSVHYVANWLS